jgi:hypothetical protein
VWFHLVLTVYRQPLNSQLRITAVLSELHQRPTRLPDDIVPELPPRLGP